MLINPIRSIKLITIRSLTRTCVTNNRSYQPDEHVIYRSANHQSTQNESNQILEIEKRKKFVHPFKRMYDWNSLEEFTNMLEKEIVYNDQKLIAINKPWGVAYHKANKTIYKPYSFETLSMIAGEPKFCIDDALPKLAYRLGFENLEYVKTIDRFSSGVVLLCGDKNAIPMIKKSLNTNKSEALAYFNFECIAQGFPSINGDELSEKVRIKLRDIDELADYKEPFIAPAIYRKQDQGNGYLARVHLKVNKINKLNSASYIRVSTNQLRWNFVRCYVADKAAFIIGDLRFSANLKRILGQQVLETTNSFYKNQRIEPLNPEILKALRVKSNRAVPLLLHLESISLRKYNGKDLKISCQLPEYFNYALNRLKLVERVSNQLHQSG